MIMAKSPKLSTCREFAVENKQAWCDSISRLECADNVAESPSCSDSCWCPIGDQLWWYFCCCLTCLQVGTKSKLWRWATWPYDVHRWCCHRLLLEWPAFHYPAATTVGIKARETIIRCTLTKQADERSRDLAIWPVWTFHMMTLGTPAVRPVREQVATSSLQTLTQLTACRVSIVLCNWQSGNDQTRSKRSKQPETITSDEVSKSETSTIAEHLSVKITQPLYQKHDYKDWVQLLMQKEGAFLNIYTNESWKFFAKRRGSGQ